MDGAQDMGGVKGFGPVEPEPDEPVFHAEWERRAFALTLAMSRPGGWNIDMSRFARENRPHDDYLSKSYYQIWLAGLERLMVERHLVSADEIEQGHSLQPPKPDVSTLSSADVKAMLHRGGPTERDPTAPALFAIGDRVRMKNDQSADAHAAAALRARPRRHRSSCCTAATCFPTPTRSGRARTRNGSTP